MPKAILQYLMLAAALAPAALKSFQRARRVPYRFLR